MSAEESPKNSRSSSPIECIEENENTQAIFEREKACTDILKPAVAIKEKVKQPEVDKFLMANQIQKNRLISKLTLVALLTNIWKYEIVITNHLTIVEHLKKVSLLPWIKQLNAYKEIIKEFVIWKEQNKYSGECGVELFLKWVSKVGFYMMFGKYLNIFTEDFLLKLSETMEQVNREYLSSVNTGNISTLSMIVPTPGPSAGVKSSKKSVKFHTIPDEENSEDEPLAHSTQRRASKVKGKRVQEPVLSEVSDSEPEDRAPKKRLRDLLDDSSDEDTSAYYTAQNTGSIPSYIVKRTEEGSLKLSSEETRGSLVVQLNVYDFRKCLGKEKNQWWQDAKYRAQMVLSSKDYVMESKLNSLIMNFKTVMKEKPDVKREAFKRKRNWN